MRFRFVHAADLHLDTPFQGIRRLAPALAEAVRDASLRAFDALVELTLAEGAAFLLLAGDIYDGPERGVRPRLHLERGLARLGEAGVPVFLVLGNHDHRRLTDDLRRLPAHVTVFPAEERRAVTVEQDGEPLAVVEGISLARADERRNLARLLSRTELPLPHIGLLHCSVGRSEGHDDVAPCGLDDLAQAGLDYYALGHVHRRSVLVDGKPFWAVYAGNLQGRSPAAGEQGAKGALVVEVERDSGLIESPRFVALDQVRFLELRLDVGQRTRTIELSEAAYEALLRLREEPQHAGRGLIVRLRIVGQGDIRELATPAVEEEILRDLMELVGVCTPFVWVESLRLDIRPEIDRERLLHRDDLLGEVVRQAEVLSGSPEELTRLVEGCLGELPAEVRARLRRGRLTLQAANLLEGAEALLLRLLEADPS